MLLAARNPGSLRCASCSYRLSICPVLSGVRRISRHRVLGRAFISSVVLAFLVILSASQARAVAAPATTSLKVTSAGNDVTSVAAGAVVTLTATVVSGTTPVNPGQVKFCIATAKHCEDSALLATAQLTTSGIATYKFRPGVGSHSYQAVFVGTGNYVKSSSTAAGLTVTQAGTYPTTATIAASGSSGDYSLTATVVGLGSLAVSPTGEVSFLDTTNGNASLGSAALETAISGRIFTTGSTSGVGADPVSIAMGDFNGDGIPDLVTLNSNDSTMTVLLGKGDGSFTIMSLSNVGSVPQSIGVGDFNGDGILDLAISDLGSEDLTILLGNGDGTFTFKSSPLAGNGPTFIAVGDFNGDGIPDLATVENDDGTVKVLLGNGDGTFISGYVMDLGHGLPYAIAVGDFNGDGNLDLATNTGTILVGNGDGTFTAAPESIPSFSGAAVGDFNGDGIADLAVANNSSVTVLLSKGNGTFTTGSTLTVGNRTGPVAVGDFNGDGITDLATANSGDNTVTVLLGKGDGSFPTQSTLDVGSKPDAIVVADFNGTGLPGLATANSGDNTVTVLLDEFTETATATLNNVSVSGTETHVIAASYPGDANFSASISDTLALTTAQTPTTLQLTSNINTSNVGSPIILTAVLTPSSSISSTTNGETVTFYNNGVSVGTGTLSSGVATLFFTSTLVGSTTLTAAYGGDANFVSATSNSIIEAITIASPATTYVVTTNTDATTGVAANCTSANSPNCSLRDALAAAAAKGAANITFDPHVFATAQTITLGSAGGLTIPSNTTINITGPTTGSGATLKNLVTVNGGGPVFTVNASANASISGLTITGGSAPYAGGGIFNSGGLTVSDSTISGNTVQIFSTFTVGGGIENQGFMSLINSTVTGNSVALNLPSGCSSCSLYGGGVDNEGTMAITNSTIVGNSISVTLGSNLGMTDINGSGGGVSNEGTLTMTDSTVAGNNANGLLPSGYPTYTVFFSGAGIGGGVTTGANNIVAGNLTNGLEDDCDSGSCGVNGVNGIIIGANAQLSPIGNYGGPTQTELPLPGSPAICAGVVADISAGITTDQRGFPRTTTYGSNAPCVDSGSVQTNYSLRFSTEPPVSTPLNTNFAATLQLNESGNPLPVSGVAIPIALATGNNGALNVSLISTNASGIAGSSTLQVSEVGTADRLVSTLMLTTSPAPAPLTSPISITTKSSTFNVVQGTQTITFTQLASPVTYGVSPIALSASVNSPLPVMFSVISGPAAVSGSTLTITAAGTVVVAANQAGNADYLAAPQVKQTIIVNKETLSFSLAAAPANPAYGQLITFTGAPAPSGTTTANFSFLIDKGTANFVTLSAASQTNATVTATYRQLKPGTHTIELSFSGTANYVAGTSPSVTVNVAQTIPVITWNHAASIPYGTTAGSLLDATTGIPGTFTYTAQETGGSSILLSASTLLAAGSYTLTASFIPNDTVDYKSATETSALVVTQKALTITANNAERVYGTANPAFTGTITGAVNGEVFTESFTTTATTTSNAGKYSIVPSVTGTDLPDYALIADNGTLTVTQAGSSTAIASSASNANLNASVTFTATVRSSTSGTPTGAVEFINGSTVLGSSPLNNQAVATYTTNVLPAGTSTINAVYNGDQNFTSSTASVAQQVTAPAFSLKSSATQLSLAAGQTGHLVITLSPVGGYTGAPSFSCTGVPQNANCTFSPSALAADGSNTPITTAMTITTDGPGTGTVGLLQGPSHGTSALLASFTGLPAFVAGLILFWNRKRLGPFARRSLCVALFATGLASALMVSACGGGPSTPAGTSTTPAGTSTISIMAAGTDNSSQSITVTLTVTQ